MLAAVSVGSLALILFLLHRWRVRPQSEIVQDGDVDKWIEEQRDVACFRYAGTPKLQERLLLRATENQRVKAAFGINNSLTTDSPAVHETFRETATRIVRKNRSWERLYNIAEGFLENEVQRAIKDTSSQGILPLAECVRCAVLAVVLYDNFGIDPVTIPRAHLVTITDEINKQWLRSKSDAGVTRSLLLDETISSLNLKSPLLSADDTESAVTTIPPDEVLSILMPQYETLWRVVLLTFVTAYHHQPQAHDDAVHRTADVPACLGDPDREEEALKLAKEGLRLFPSNKHLYRSATSTPSSPNPNPTTTSVTVKASISSLHRHPSIWGGNDMDALAFRPARFDEGSLTDRQRKAYMPFSVRRHKCPAAAGAKGKGSFGERMVTLLVVALGRALGPERGRVVFESGIGATGREDMLVGELPTGRDDAEGWVWEGFEIGGRGW